MAHDATKTVAILGTFVVDLTFIAGRAPAMGETILGEHFRIGPGGKGSNQAIAAQRAGADVTLITKLGCDEFGDRARKLYAAEGVSDRYLVETADQPTGAASIFVDAGSGENAIVIVTGAGGTITAADVDAAAEGIAGAAVFMTQLEVPDAAAARGLAIAKANGVTTVFDSALAAPFPESMYRTVDYLTPNETEAALLAGAPVRDLVEAEAAADRFLALGVGAAVITLGERGALVKSGSQRAHVPAPDSGPIVETTGAGDAFNGALAVALAEGADEVEAVRFGCAAGALSVTRAGAATSMPQRAEINALLAQD